jgi:hypothetical protein
MAKIKKGAQGAITTAAHKARRIAKEASRQATFSLSAKRRLWLRKRGALNRIDRRIDRRIAAGGDARLQTVRIKVAAAEVAARP